jgi:hypothetical protein
MRDRLRLALGPELMTRLQGHLEVEQTMTKLKRAVSGNSTTLQQTLAAGVVGGAGGQWFGDDPMTKTSNASIGAVAGAVLARGNAKLSHRVATHIGNLLASDNPADWQRVAVMAQRNPAINQAWNELKNYAQRAAAQQAGTEGAEQMR